MGEEADWRGLEEEEGTLSPPAAEDDQREMCGHVFLSSLGTSLRTCQKTPRRSAAGPTEPGRAQRHDKRLDPGAGGRSAVLGASPARATSPGQSLRPTPSLRMEPKSMPQGGRHRHRRLFCNSSAKEEARSLQTTLGVVGKRSGRVSD